MRLILLALVLISLPVIIGWLRGGAARRDQAMLVIGVLAFAVGEIRTTGTAISWPVWPGTSTGASISFLDMLALALIITRKSGSERLKFRLITGLYCFCIFLSCLVSYVPMASSFIFVESIRAFIVFIAIAGEVKREKAISNLFIGLSLGLFIQAGYVISQKMTGVVQATGTLAHQNTLGMMVELAVIPMIAAVLEGQRSKLVYLGICAGLIVIAGGGSRATMGIVVAAIIVLTVLSIARRATPRKTAVVGVGVLALAIAIPLGLSTLKERFGSESMVTEEDQRAAFQRAAKAMANDHLFGVGPNLYVTIANTEGYSERAGVAWNQGNRRAPVHNAYLLSRAEMGWFGQIITMALMILPVLAGLRFAFQNKRGSVPGVVLGSAVAVAAIALHSMFEFAWHVHETRVLFFINLAIIAGAIRASQINRSEDRRAASAESDETSLPVPVGVEQGLPLPKIRSRRRL